MRILADTTSAVAAAILSAGLGLLLLSAGLEGRMWRGMWFLPWVPGG